MARKQNSELAVAEPAAPPASADLYGVVAQSDTSNPMSELREEWGDGVFDRDDLPNAKFPTGGITQWVLDDDETVKELRGVILTQQFYRAWWDRPFGSGESGPPICSALGMANTVGTTSQENAAKYGVGGNCGVCPKNEWGSAVHGDGTPGRGKACAERVAIIVQTRDLPLPYLVSIPVTSRKRFKQFISRQTRGTPSTSPANYWKYEVALGLEMVKNQNGPDYAQITLRRLDNLSDTDLAIIEPWRKQWHKLLPEFFGTPDKIEAEFAEQPIDADLVQ